MFAAKNELFTRPNGGYNLTRSLRFRSSASAYLNRTPAGAGNRRTWTYSTWVKLGSLSTALNLLYAYSADTDSGLCQLSYQSNQLRIQGITASFLMVSTAVYRDPSAWYHVVYSVDTTQATAANRVRVYVNGVQITAWSTNAPPPQNTDTAINNNVAHNIGRNTRNSDAYFDGYMAEVNLIDGQALTPSSFGAFSLYNQWLPKKYAGTYGTNGFYLPFTNNASAATLGNDFSGNSNTWTTNNISVTTGSTYDSTTDVPTLTSATAANFATLNPLTGGSSTTSDGNLAATIAPVNGARVSTIAVTSGKFYCEMVATTVNGYFVMGIGAPYSKGWDSSQESSPNSITWATSGASSPYVQAKGSWTLSSNTISTTYTTGDVVGIALNMDSNTLTFYKNGTSQGSMTINTQGIPAAFLIGNSSGASNGAGYVNFGQRPFAYTPPSGYVALNTFNL
jgi:hypothetical protein